MIRVGWNVGVSTVAAVAPVGVSAGPVSLASFTVPPTLGSIVWNALLLATGVFLLYHGFRWYRLGRVVADTPTAKPGTAAAGRVEVEGTAQPAGEAIVAPFTGEDCVYLSWRLEERVDDEWVERASETRIEPFYLEGGGGRLLVRADEFPDEDELPWEYDSRRFESDDGMPDEIRRFLAEYDAGERGSGTRTNPATTTNPARTTPPGDGASTNEWRFVKRLLPPGTDLYVFGSVEPKLGHSELGITVDETTGWFVINRSNEELMISGTRWFGLLALSAGLLFTLWGGAATVGLVSSLVL